MPESRRMQTPPVAILRFPAQGHPDLPLGAGVSGLCPDPDLDRGLMLTSGGHASLIEFCSDARGLWLHVADGVRGMHVNGRPVQRLARLHLGDSLHFEGIEIQLVDPLPRAPTILPADSAARADGFRFSLRGLCGADHGRAIDLSRPVAFPSAENAEEGAKIVLRGGTAWLDAGSAAVCLLNGIPATVARLRDGDQLMFAPDQRYRVEAPVNPDVSLPDPAPARAAASAGRGSGHHRARWLMLAALASAAGLAALLWFGVK